MKPPKRITIVGHDYEVLSVPDGGVDDHGVGEAGYFDSAKCEIGVNKELAEASRRDTVMHEVLHALAHHCAIYKLDEKIVAALSPALLDTLRRNPRLAAYLLDRGLPADPRRAPVRHRSAGVGDPGGGVSAVSALPEAS